MKVSTTKKRQKVILRIISRSGGKINRLRLMKFAFLFSCENREDGFYQFVPYKHGPFSFTLYNELNKLAQNKLIHAPSDKEISLNSVVPSTLFALDKQMEVCFERFWSKYSDFRTNEIVDFVYEKYPWFTINCEQEERRAAQTPKADCSIYMIGYEGLHVDGFLNMLLEKGIKTLIDVRHNPLSRVYGFHKSTLTRISKNIGLNYYHCPELGIPSSWRKELDSEDDYSNLFERYHNAILSKNEETLKKLADIILKEPSVLMCQESDPLHCHRAHIADSINKITDLRLLDIRDSYEQTPVN